LWTGSPPSCLSDVVCVWRGTLTTSSASGGRSTTCWRCFPTDGSHARPLQASSVRRHELVGIIRWSSRWHRRVRSVVSSVKSLNTYRSSSGSTCHHRSCSHSSLVQRMPRGGEGSGGERIRPRTATAEEQLQASGGRKDRDKKQKSGRGSNESDEGEATAAARTLFSELFGEKGEKIDMGKVVITMQKQILNNTQTLRMLIAGCMTTVLVPPSEESFRDGVATGPEYDRKVKAAGTNHNLGPPFAAVFLNMFEKLVEKHKGALSVEDRGFAEKLVKQMVADGHSFTTELVTVCICRETFETKDRRRRVASPSPTTSSAWPRSRMRTSGARCSPTGCGGSPPRCSSMPAALASRDHLRGPSSSESSSCSWASSAAAAAASENAAASNGRQRRRCTYKSSQLPRLGGQRRRISTRRMQVPSRSRMMGMDPWAFFFSADLS